MNDKLERPTSLRRVPRPAADEKIDPVDFAAQATTPHKPAPQESTAGSDPTPSAPASTTPSRGALAPAPIETIATGRPGRPRRREITMPFSTRLAVEVVDLLDDVVLNQGITQRAAVEMAIREKWGTPSN